MKQNIHDVRQSVPVSRKCRRNTETLTSLPRWLINYAASLDCQTNSRYTHLDTLRNNGIRNVQLRLGSHSVPFSGRVQTIQRKRTHVHRPSVSLKGTSCTATSICYDVWIRLMYHQHSNMDTMDYFKYSSRDSPVGIATTYTLNSWGFGIQVPVGEDFSCLHVVQTGSRVHPASYPIGSGNIFPGTKADGKWSWPLISDQE
jgi:hypothetical protein